MSDEKKYCKICDKDVDYIQDWGTDQGYTKFCKECDAEIKEIEYNYKFCILAAGKGTRNKTILGLHKALLPLENKAVISHIIDKLPVSIEIVIALGHEGAQIQSYLKQTHPERNIKYVYVDNYDRPGSGPGYSLLSCESELQSPFIYTAVDTLIEENFVFNILQENWIGVSKISLDDSLKYCLVKGAKYLETLYYGNGNRAFIGIAGIYDYCDFWKSLKNDKTQKGELQVDRGIQGLKKVRLIDLTWHDTGNNKSYEQTRKNFPNEIIATKNQEALFSDNKKIIKYFSDKSKVDSRVMRTEYLKGFCPQVKRIHSNMYAYDFVEGSLLSDIQDKSILCDVLNFYHDNFYDTSRESSVSFLKNCQEMYYNKTYQRCQPFINTALDNIEYINGIKVDKIQNLLDKVDFELIYSNAIPSSFHGDFQPENIIYNRKLEKFILIDWRESFGDSIEEGDYYYDLGKLYHALLINGKTILNKLYGVKIKNNSAYLEFYSKNNLSLLMKEFERFASQKHYNWLNIKLLGILQYIGISSLYEDFHNGTYGEFLFLYGKYLLTEYLDEKINEKINQSL